MDQAPDQATPDQSPQDPPADDGSGNGADADVSFQKFYDSLAGQGTWIQNSQYGSIWQPTVSDPQWAPYTEGHWVYTQDGWTWLSDEPWGWATCHYGRWVFLNNTGWCWVPGYTWGPAWVSWRYGDGYCGWAPLPPDSLQGVDYDSGDGFHIGGDCDAYYGIDPGWYCFLPVVYLGENHYRGYYARRADNARFLDRTTNVTNINISRHAGRSRFGGVSLGGPSFQQANSHTQTPIPRLQLTSATHEGGAAIQGNSVAVYAPRLARGSVANVRPGSDTRSISRGENAGAGTRRAGTSFGGTPSVIHRGDEFSPAPAPLYSPRRSVDNGGSRALGRPGGGFSGGGQGERSAGGGSYRGGISPASRPAPAGGPGDAHGPASGAPGPQHK